MIKNRRVDLYTDRELRILMLENVAADAELIERELRKGGIVFSSRRVETKEDFQKELRDFMPDIILADFSLPTFSGLSALLIVKKESPDVPLILVSGAIGEELAVKMLKEGATDYVLKSHLSHLVPAVNRALHEAEERAERKGAEERLQQSEEYFRAVIENSSDVIIIVDKKGTITYTSPSIERFLGYKPKELIGKSSFNFILPADLPRAIFDFGKAIITKEVSIPNVFRVRHKNGSERILEGLGRNLLDNPVVAGFVINARDVSERKQVEAALRTSEAQLSNALRIAHLGHWEYDVVSDLFTFNDNFYAIFRTTAEEVGGYTMSSSQYAERFIHPADISIVSPEIQKAIETNDPLYSRQLEHRIIYADGETGYITVRFFIVKDDQGKTVKTYGANQDITERKKAEKMLINASEEWRSTFDSMPYGVMLLDKEHNITRVNNYISKLTGLSYKDIIGQKCYKVILGKDELTEECPLPDSSNIRGTETFEFHIPRFNKDFVGYMTPVAGKENLVDTFVLSLVDITEIKDKEKKLTENRDAFLNMLKDLDISFKELAKLYNSLILAFVNAIDAKSPWTKGHSERVTAYAISIAKEMGLKEKEIETLRIAALLHDIGKIGTYDVILDKPGKLTDEEFALIRMHPVRGEEILRPIGQLQNLLPIIRAHHERLDGKGYPDKLKGEEIPLLARIICVADSFDSMTSDRPYRPAPPKEYAISEINKCSGTQFDIQAAEAFLKVLSKSQR